MAFNELIAINPKMGYDFLDATDQQIMFRVEKLIGGDLSITAEAPSVLRLSSETMDLTAVLGALDTHLELTESLHDESIDDPALQETPYHVLEVHEPVPLDTIPNADSSECGCSNPYCQV